MILIITSEFGHSRTDPDLRAEIIESVRIWVAKEVIPHAAELAREDRFPAEMVQQMRDHAGRAATTCRCGRPGPSLAEPPGS